MKILHVETGRHFLGGPQQVIYLINALRERGHDSILVCPPDSGIDTVAPGNVDTNPYLAPIAGASANPFDNWGIPVLLGALIGGFVSGVIGGRVRLQTYHGPRITPERRWMFALVGGALVGFGARLARGCTSGQALSGGAMLSLGSWAFMFSVFIGGYALAWFVRGLWQEK